MEDSIELKKLLSQIELHIEEEITFINDLCKEHFVSYDNETIVFYLLLRKTFKDFKKELRKLIKNLEQRKDNL